MKSYILFAAIIGSTFAQSLSRPSKCLLPMEIGPCEALMPRFYFNSDTKYCEAFNYGGCQGNENNFLTASDCEDTCDPCPLPTPQAEPEPGCNYVPKINEKGCTEYDYVCDETPEICLQPKQTGLCKAYMPSYYYNDETKKCERFIYGGCGGNDNRFGTQQECNKECRVKPAPVEVHPGSCPRTSGFGTCVEACSSDADCKPLDKCCSNGCGHTCQRAIGFPPPPGGCALMLCPACSNCVEDENGRGQCVPLENCPKDPKPGKCPSSSGMIGICVNACSSDSSCPGQKKCCSNGCGKVCKDPVSKTDGNDPCDPDPCRSSQRCIPEPKNCFTTPCNQYRCVERNLCATVRCSSCHDCVVRNNQPVCQRRPGCGDICLMPRLAAPPEGCRYDTERRNGNCPTYELICDCKDNNCAEDEVCIPEKKNCFTTPCYQYRCEKKPSDPCKPNPCKKGKQCIPNIRVCKRGPCRQYKCKNSKPGKCPSTSGMFGICVQACSSDSACPGRKKCCSNGCGNVCKNPVSKIDSNKCRRNRDCKGTCARCFSGQCTQIAVRCAGDPCEDKTCPRYPKATCKRQKCSCGHRFVLKGRNVTKRCNRRG